MHMHAHTCTHTHTHAHTRTRAHTRTHTHTGREMAVAGGYVSEVIQRLFNVSAIPRGSVLLSLIACMLVGLLLLSYM